MLQFVLTPLLILQSWTLDFPWFFLGDILLILPLLPRDHRSEGHEEGFKIHFIIFGVNSLTMSFPAFFTRSYISFNSALAPTNFLEQIPLLAMKRRNAAINALASTWIAFVERQINNAIKAFLWIRERLFFLCHFTSYLYQPIGVKRPHMTL